MKSGPPSPVSVQERRTTENSSPYKGAASPDSWSAQPGPLSPPSLVIPNRTVEEPKQDRPSDPLGLSLLYKPCDLPSIDIVFVHGLGGTSQQTWSRDKNPDLFWPHKWLPTEPEIQTARVLSFGYDAKFSARGSLSLASISDFAKDLLYAMKFGKDDATNELDIGKRPVVFVVHSMGGLVDKKVQIFPRISLIFECSDCHRPIYLDKTMKRIKESSPRLVQYCSFPLHIEVPIWLRR